MQMVKTAMPESKHLFVVLLLVVVVLMLLLLVVVLMLLLLVVVLMLLVLGNFNTESFHSGIHLTGEVFKFDSSPQW